jgi:membrane protein YdbS with pleckstrin-like domain
MSYVSKNLLNGETVAYRTKLHWKLFLAPILISALILMPLTLFALRSQSKWLALIPLALIVAVFFPAYLRRVSSEFAVTNKRVIMKVGVLTTRSFELLLPKVEGIAVNQGVFGKVFDYGDIVVTGSGGTQEPFTDIQGPLQFRHAVQAVTDSKSSP